MGVWFGLNFVAKIGKDAEERACNSNFMLQAVCITKKQSSYANSFEWLNLTNIEN